MTVFAVLIDTIYIEVNPDVLLLLFFLSKRNEELEQEGVCLSAVSVVCIKVS